MAFAGTLACLMCLDDMTHAADRCAETPALSIAATTEGEDGIGGTGLGGEEDGIGGTGIFGTITGFGSLCVNGLRIHYDEEVGVAVDGVSATPQALAVGQVVWVEASSRDGRIWAEAISVESAVVGPVTVVDHEQRHVDIYERGVEIPTDAIVFSVAGGHAAIALGDFVAVSGLRRPDGQIVASRIDRADPALGEKLATLRVENLLRRSPRIRRLSVEGYIRERDDLARFRVDGIEVDASGLPSALSPREVGARVWVSGRVTADGEIAAERMMVHPTPVDPLRRPGPDAVNPPSGMPSSGPN
jgi:hypothetical protein